MGGECVGSGYCCRKAPCGWSWAEMKEDGLEWDKNEGCPYLVQVGIQWRCGIYLEANDAKKEMMARDMGIGAGCSSTLFNRDREEMIRRLRSLSSSDSPATSSVTSAVPTPSNSR